MESEAKHFLSNQQPLGKKSEKKVLYHCWDEMGMAAIQLLLSDSEDGDSNKVFVYTLQLSLTFPCGTMYLAYV